MEQRCLVVGQQIAARGSLLGRNIGIIDQIRQDPVQALAGVADRTLVLRILTPLGPIGRRARGAGWQQRQAASDRCTYDKRQDTA
jgi:hypothetical protein